LMVSADEVDLEKDTLTVQMLCEVAQRVAVGYGATVQRTVVAARW
jgi:hypothetical protein